MKSCGHIGKKRRNYHPPYYANWPFYEKPPEPTPEEINRYRLWKCPDCGQWSSLIGTVAKYPEKVSV